MIYEYKCVTCHKKATATRPMKDRHIGPICCNEPMEKHIFTPGMPNGSWGDHSLHYKCVATGENITSAKQRSDIMERNGLSDAREFDQPDPGALQQEHDEVYASANAETDLPPELTEAMAREGLDNIL
jgi:hypothetical protein